LEILIIHNKRKVVPKAEVLLFTTKKNHPMKQVHLRDMFKKAYKIVCTSTTVVSPDPLSPTASASSPMKTYKTQNRTLITLN